MEAALLDRLAQANPVNEAVRAAIQWLGQHPDGHIEQLSRWIGFSSCQLQRRFTTAVGYGPKMFQSVLRFQRLLNLTRHARAPRNLAQLSADAGYADQAHMTREVAFFRQPANTAAQIRRMHSPLVRSLPENWRPGPLDWLSDSFKTDTRAPIYLQGHDDSKRTVGTLDAWGSGGVPFGPRRISDH
jgi:AraC-like DNA-binding protein